MSAKPCICFINTTTFWGGGERFNLDYARTLRARGYPVILLAKKGSKLYLRANEKGIKTIPLTASSLSFLNPFKLIHLISIFRKKQIQVIVLSSSQDLKLAGLAGKIAGVSRIIYRRGLASTKKNSFLNRYYFGRVVTDLVCNSQASKNSLTENLGNVLKNKTIHLIPNGIDLSERKIQPEQLPIEFQQNKRTLILGNVGRLTEQKGQVHLLNMALSLKLKSIPFSLFIAGSGELRETLEKKIKEKGLEKEVYLLGFLEDIPSFLASIDIFILSSLWEGFGYVIIEAMQQSKPVIAFETSSNPEILKDQENGLLVKEINGIGLAHAVEEYYINPSLGEMHGKSGFDYVQSTYNLDHQVDKFLSILKPEIE